MREKRQLVLGELSSIPPVLVLRFESKKNYGVLFATRTETETRRWVGVPVPPCDEASLSDLKPLDNQTACIIAGIGNTQNFEELITKFKTGLAEAASLHGELDENITASAVHSVATAINRRFALSYYDAAYSVELAVLSILGGKLKIFQIRYDGHYEHLTAPFCIVGGQKNIGSGKNIVAVPETIKGRATCFLAELYRKNRERHNRLPSLTVASKAAAKVLAFGDYPGKILAVEFSFEKK